MTSSFPSNSACVHCSANLKKPDVKSGVCTQCWEGIVIPAYRHVESVKPDDSHGQMWHVLELRDAFIAGALHVKKQNVPDQETEKGKL